MDEQKHGEILADNLLQQRCDRNISEDLELKVTTNRTLINKCSTTEESTEEQMSQGTKLFAVNVARLYQSRICLRRSVYEGCGEGCERKGGKPEG